MESHQKLVGAVVLVLMASIYAAWNYDRSADMSLQQQDTARQLAELRQMVESTSGELSKVSRQLDELAAQKGAEDKKAAERQAEFDQKLDDLRKSGDTGKQASSNADKSLDALSHSFSGIAFLMEMTKPVSQESREPVSFSAVSAGKPVKGPVFDGAGGRDTVNISYSGSVMIDGAHTMNIERYTLANEKANDVFIFAPGLNGLEDNWLELEVDGKEDRVFLDGCLDWKKAKTAKAKSAKGVKAAETVEWIATDKDKQTRKVTFSTEVATEVMKACDNRYAFTLLRREFPLDWYNKSREIEKKLVLDSDSGEGTGVRAAAPSLREESEREKDRRSHKLDNPANIARYKDWAADLPEEARRAMVILIGLMEKGKLDTVFTVNGSVSRSIIEPLRFSTDTVPVISADAEFDCNKSRLEERRNGLPMIITGNGLNIKCSGGSYYLFSGDLDDKVEFGASGFNVIAPGKGTDTIKAVKGGSITILESGWGHKTIEKACLLEAGLKQGPPYFVDSTNDAFGGVGVQYRMEAAGAVVVKVFAQQAAEDSGIAAGDTITAVDGKPLAGLKDTDTAKLIRGKAGSSVKLSYRKKGEEQAREVTLVRRIVQLGGRFKSSFGRKIDFTPLYPHENYLVFGPGVSPQDMKEEPEGKWTNTRTGDTLTVPACFNFVYTDAPRD